MALTCTKNVYYIYSCLSTDIKPTERIEEGSSLFELDTGREFIFRGGAWHETPDSLMRNRAIRLATVGAVTYVGKAPPGALESDAVWQIMKIDETEDLSITWALGKSSFTNRWSQRTSLAYR